MVNYTKYVDCIINMVIESKNPSLFPDLNIPRSTALYWIKSSKKKKSIETTSIDCIAKEKIKKLEAELRVERAKNLLMAEMIKKLIGFKSLFSHTKNRRVLVEGV